MPNEGGKTPEMVLPKEVGDANTTAYVIQLFASQMLLKMQKNQARFDPPWLSKEWQPGELDKEIFRCIQDEDYVSIANFAMIAQFHKGSLSTGDRHSGLDQNQGG